MHQTITKAPYCNQNHGQATPDCLNMTVDDGGAAAPTWGLRCKYEYLFNYIILDIVSENICSEVMIWATVFEKFCTI